MTSTRLEAFSDGVIAVIITIMVLELRPPALGTLEALTEHGLVQEFLAYVLSFVFIGIYWNNHHHLMHAVDRVNGAIMWANLHLLFWLSLVPFSTAWVGKYPQDAWPAAVYGIVLAMAGSAYYLIVRLVISDQLSASDGRHSKLRDAVGQDVKGVASIVIYLTAIGLAFVNQWLADALYVTVALMWLVPDRRITRQKA